MQILWKQPAVVERIAIVANFAILTLPLFLPATGLGGNLCMIKATTGVDCPGCGLTRSFIALVHGDTVSSFVFHPMGPLLYLFFALLLVNRIHETWRVGWSARWVERKAVFAALSIGLLGNWAWRLLF